MSKLDIRNMNMAATEEQFLIHFDSGETLGPVDLPSLKALATRGFVQGSTSLTCVGTGSKKRAAQVPGLLLFGPKQDRAPTMEDAAPMAPGASAKEVSSHIAMWLPTAAGAILPSAMGWSQWFLLATVPAGVVVGVLVSMALKKE
jgi:hypothetical protein